MVLPQAPINHDLSSVDDISGDELLTSISPAADTIDKFLTPDDSVSVHAPTKNSPANSPISSTDDVPPAVSSADDAPSTAPFPAEFPNTAKKISANDTISHDIKTPDPLGNFRSVTPGSISSYHPANDNTSGKAIDLVTSAILPLAPKCEHPAPSLLTEIARRQRKAHPLPRQILRRRIVSDFFEAPIADTIPPKRQTINRTLPADCTAAFSPPVYRPKVQLFSTR